jgi:hypothetical protein
MGVDNDVARRPVSADYFKPAIGAQNEAFGWRDSKHPRQRNHDQ